MNRYQERSKKDPLPELPTIAVSYSCSVDVSDISERERVPKSAPDVPVGNQGVPHDLYSSAVFKEENTERLNKEPRTVLCEGNLFGDWW